MLVRSEDSMLTRTFIGHLSGEPCMPMRTQVPRAPYCLTPSLLMCTSLSHYCLTFITKTVSRTQ